MKKMDAYIAVRGSNNITELSDVPAEKMKLLAKKMRPVQDQRVKKTKWVVLRWPTPSMAQLAGMSTEVRLISRSAPDYRRQPSASAQGG
jgi:aminopeptidase